MSAGGTAASSDRTAIRSGRAVIGRLLGDRHVMHVTFAYTGGGDAYERGPGAHLLDVVAAGVAHRGAQTAGQLIQDRDQAALVEHAALDAFRHQFLQLGGCVLEIAVGRAVSLGHRNERAHAAIGLVRRALIYLVYTWRLLGAGEHAADHHRMRPGGDRLGKIARVADAAVGDHRYAAALERGGNVGHRGNLR